MVATKDDTEACAPTPVATVLILNAPHLLASVSSAVMTAGTGNSATYSALPTVRRVIGTPARASRAEVTILSSRVIAARPVAAIVLLHHPSVNAMKFLEYVLPVVEVVTTAARVPMNVVIVQTIHATLPMVHAVIKGVWLVGTVDNVCKNVV